MIHFSGFNIDTHNPIQWFFVINRKDWLKKPFEIDLLKYCYGK